MALARGGVGLVTTVVIDIGCARHGNDYSIERLVIEGAATDGIAPDVLYGCDPSDAMDATIEQWREHPAPVTELHLTKSAAWTFDGEIGFREDGLNSWITELKGAPQVPCFDLAAFIGGLAERELGVEIILKMDCEGSEYDLLRHLILRGTDRLVKLAWVEFHEPDRGRAKIEEEWAGEIVEWRW